MRKEEELKEISMDAAVLSTGVGGSLHPPTGFGESYFTWQRITARYHLSHIKSSTLYLKQISQFWLFRHCNLSLRV